MRDRVKVTSSAFTLKWDKKNQQHNLPLQRKCNHTLSENWLTGKHNNHTRLSPMGQKKTFSKLKSTQLGWSCRLCLCLLCFAFPSHEDSRQINKTTTLFSNLSLPLTSGYLKGITIPGKGSYGSADHSRYLFLLESNEYVTFSLKKKQDETHWYRENIHTGLVSLWLSETS